MKIFLLDDSRFIRNTIKRFLTALGHTDVEVFEAAGEKEGVPLFEEAQPDVLILDLLIQDTHGTEVLKKLQHIPHSCFIAVMSADSQLPMQQEVKDLGANMFVPKPVTVEKITLILEEYQKFSDSE